MLLDDVLDKLKVAMEETEAAQNESSTSSSEQEGQEKPAHKGFRIFGGK